MKKEIVTALTNKAKEAEVLHRRTALAERYGQAAYNQGVRDGLIAAAALVESALPDAEEPITANTAAS